MIGIVDYGLGNLASVAGAIERLGFDPCVSSDPDSLGTCDKLILPGVGAFGDGMRNLRDRGLIEPLNAFVVGKGTPVLGICLGSQLMTRSSEEFGWHDGLGWIDGTVTRIRPDDPGLRVPTRTRQSIHRQRHPLRGRPQIIARRTNSMAGRRLPGRRPFLRVLGSRYTDVLRRHLSGSRRTWKSTSYRVTRTTVPTGGVVCRLLEPAKEETKRHNRCRFRYPCHDA